MPDVTSSFILSGAKDPRAKHIHGTGIPFCPADSGFAGGSFPLVRMKGGEDGSYRIRTINRGQALVIVVSSPVPET